MITAITAAILYLVALPGGGYVGHFRESPTGPEARAASYAHLIVDAARMNELDPYLLTALIARESGFNQRARSRAGAFGLTQLHPRYWGREALRRCNASPELCSWWSVWYGAVALRHYVETCGNEARGVTAYRTGACKPVGPEARKVIRLRAVISSKFPVSRWVVGEAVIL